MSMRDVAAELVAIADAVEQSSPAGPKVTRGMVEEAINQHAQELATVQTDIEALITRITALAQAIGETAAQSNTAVTDLETAADRTNAANENTNPLLDNAAQAFVAGSQAMTEVTVTLQVVEAEATDGATLLGQAVDKLRDLPVTLAGQQENLNQTASCIHQGVDGVRTVAALMRATAPTA